MEQETRALRLSVVMSLVMAALGLGFGWISGSNAILLDGFFSLIGFAMALVTIRVARLVRQPADEHFHFGYAQFEPFLNTVKGLLMLGVAGFALAASIDALLHGGREIQPGLGIVYAAVALAGCLAVGAAQKRAADRLGSPLLSVDSKNWMIDGLLSGVVAAVFVLALILGRTSFAYVVPYIDPILVIVLILGIAAVPIRTIRDGLREILAFAPEPAVQDDVQRRVEGALADVPLSASHVRMMKVGRFLYVLNQLVVSPEFKVGSVADLDAVRARIAAAMEGVEPTPVVDTLFTEDQKWTE
ncbi:MAG: cation diffusion facilitator family transporter [Gemmatimonadetes bacterium]|nr:cation diffusion facilitator family transporter [Gemmatimonadota bacterium]MBT8479558.1 cation diffusion facilitator family transporter [Gemmatimonadota bacterium]NNK47652.1 cation diffusion facilitator family transporter [Gemmatimonadota bacterium]